MVRQDELKPQPPVQKWTEKTAPKAFKREDSEESFQGGSPYRQTMTGKIVAIVLTTSGPGSLALSDTESFQILYECIAGLKFWSDKANEEGVFLSFVVYWVGAAINAPNPISCPTWQYCHNVFADAAIQALGYPSGQAGKDQIAQYYKNIVFADGAFLAFFSKYRQGHFAYAYFGGGSLYMQYSNDGWGPNQIDRVFAHEIGHVFNAPDEYIDCECAQLYGKGSCTATNFNCKDCTAFQSKCIMDSNDLNNICDNTKKHVGWC